MDDKEARALVALIQAFFPVPKIADSTLTVWSNALKAFPFATAKQAVTNVGTRGTGGRPVQLGDITTEVRDLIRDQTRDNARDDIFPPSPKALEAAAPDDVKAVLRRYWDGVGKGREGSSRVKATANIDPEARVEAGRLAAQASIEREMNPVEVARIGAERPPKEPKDLLQPGDVCGGIGKLSVMIDGVACCPVCQSPVETFRKVWVRDDSKKGGHYEQWREGGCYPSKEAASE